MDLESRRILGRFRVPRVETNADDSSTKQMAYGADEEESFVGVVRCFVRNMMGDCATEKVSGEMVEWGPNISLPLFPSHSKYTQYLPPDFLFIPIYPFIPIQPPSSTPTEREAEPPPPPSPPTPN